MKSQTSVVTSPLSKSSLILSGLLITNNNGLVTYLQGSKHSEILEAILNHTSEGISV